MTTSECEETGKFCYETRRMAENVIERKDKMRRTKSKLKSPNKRNHLKLDRNVVSSYKCKFCNKWHLTSK